MFGKPVGTTMTLRPLGRVFSVAGKGRTSPVAASAAAGKSSAQRSAVRVAVRIRGTLTQFRARIDPRLTAHETESFRAARSRRDLLQGRTRLAASGGQDHRDRF